MEKNSLFDGIVTLLLIVLGLLVLTIISCSPKYPNIHTPTKREIKKAMKYSTSEYYMVRPSDYSNYQSVYRGQ